MREYRYVLVDVFTDTPLLGNQLAVFLDGEGLSDAEMQALARETNLSETTFCFPREGAPEEVAADGVRVRIFTPVEELPFAGHPTLGSATVLRCALPALQGTAQVKLRLPVGVVPVRFSGEPAAGEETKLPFGQPVRGEMEQPLPVFGRRHDAEAVAAALGLPVGAINAIDRDKPIETVSTGVPFVVVPLVSQAALRALAVPQQAAERYMREVGGRFFYVLAPGTDPVHWYARMQFYGREDPATGSAAGCATAWLVHHGYAPAGTPLVIEQGVEMGRRSLLHCSALLLPAEGGSDPGTAGVQKWGAGSYVRVGGSTVLVAEGRFFLS